MLLPAEGVAAARDRQKRQRRRGAAQAREQGRPGREFVGVVRDDEGAGLEDAVVDVFRGCTATVIFDAAAPLLLVQRVKERLGHDGPLKHPVPDAEGVPGLAPARVEAPAGPALGVEDVDEQAVAAGDVDEAAEAVGGLRGGVHLPPQADEEGGDGEVFKDVLGGRGRFDPGGDQVGGVGGLEAGVGVLHGVLGDDVVFDGARAEVEAAAGVCVRGGLVGGGGGGRC